ncbi:hypothetical protein RND71_022325 [Anisodus tanguticus]|uniref:Uncharacterized protein n=1 Tax=Anisodus tanguticus TaxID=243964 RepID=A0AAE1S074_9SOLA|nr:hypothetical protein RND71_022325 [Anisodus tanguticus]
MQSHPTLNWVLKSIKQVGDAWNGRWWYKLIVKMMQEWAERIIKLTYYFTIEQNLYLNQGQRYGSS